MSAPAVSLLTAYVLSAMMKTKEELQMAKVIDVLKIKVKEVWERSKGHKQGNQYGRSGSHDDKRFGNRGNEKVKFKKDCD